MAGLRWVIVALVPVVALVSACDDADPEPQSEGPVCGLLDRELVAEALGSDDLGAPENVLRPKDERDLVVECSVQPRHSDRALRFTTVEGADPPKQRGEAREGCAELDVPDGWVAAPVCPDDDTDFVVLEAWPPESGRHLQLTLYNVDETDMDSTVRLGTDLLIDANEHINEYDSQHDGE